MRTPELLDGRREETSQPEEGELPLPALPALPALPDSRSQVPHQTEM